MENKSLKYTKQQSRGKKNSKIAKVTRQVVNQTRAQNWLETTKDAGRTSLGRPHATSVGGLTANPVRSYPFRRRLSFKFENN